MLPGQVEQLTLPFPELARNTQTLEQAIREKYPMTAKEAAMVPAGVRLARFVPFAECAHCPFATCDHRLSPEDTILVCLKDLQQVRKKGENPQGSVPSDSSRGG